MNVEPMLIIFGTYFEDKVNNQKMFHFLTSPAHLSSASALPGETGKGV